MKILPDQKADCDEASLFEQTLDVEERYLF